MRLLDDAAALTLFEAIARQAHRDAAGLDGATPDERTEALTWLAHWQGCDSARAQVQPVRVEYAKRRKRRGGDSGT